MHQNKPPDSASLGLLAERLERLGGGRESIDRFVGKKILERPAVSPLLKPLRAPLSTRGAAGAAARAAIAQENAAERVNAAAMFDAFTPPSPAPATPAPFELGGYVIDGGRRLTRLERKCRAREEENAHRTRTLEKWKAIAEARAELAGVARELRVIPRSVWITCWAVVSDPSGLAAQEAWRGLPIIRRARMMRAALCILDAGDGTAVARYRWTDLRARRICALALALHMLSERTWVRGRWGGGEVKGITRRAFCELLRDVHDDRESAVPAVSTVFGTHRPGATLESGELGYMPALREAGYAYRRQLPIAKAHPCERFGDWASNRYQLASTPLERAFDSPAEGFRRQLQRIAEASIAWLRDGFAAALDALRRPWPS